MSARFSLVAEIGGLLQYPFFSSAKDDGPIRGARVPSSAAALMTVPGPPRLAAVAAHSPRRLLDLRLRAQRSPALAGVHARLLLPERWAPAAGCWLPRTWLVALPGSASLGGAATSAPPCPPASADGPRSRGRRREGDQRDLLPSTHRPALAASPTTSSEAWRHLYQHRLARTWRSSQRHRRH